MLNIKWNKSDKSYEIVGEIKAKELEGTIENAHNKIIYELKEDVKKDLSKQVRDIIVRQLDLNLLAKEVLMEMGREFVRKESSLDANFK